MREKEFVISLRSGVLEHFVSMDLVEGVVGEWELLELKTLSREKLTRRGCIVRASTV